MALAALAAAEAEEAEGAEAKGDLARELAELQASDSPRASPAS